MKKYTINFAFVLLLFCSCTAKTEPPKVEILNANKNEIVFAISPKATSNFAIILRQNEEKQATSEQIVKVFFHNKTEFKEKIFLHETEKISKNNYVIFSGSLAGEKQINFQIFGHNSQKSHVLDVFVIETASETKSAEQLKVFSFPINILAAEPTSQASNIVFANIKFNSIDVSCQNGNGKGRIIVVSTDSLPEKPNRGTFYPPGVFGTEGKHKIGKNSYVIYNSLEKEEKFAKIANLKSATYHFFAYEFNGEDGNTNYNLNYEKRNKVSFTLPLEPPKIKPATNIMQDGFYMNWEAVKNAEIYEITLAKDENFLKIDEIFNNADVGNITEYPFEQLEFGETYFCKVRAKLADGRYTDFSEPLKVQLAKK